MRSSFTTARRAAAPAACSRDRQHHEPADGYYRHVPARQRHHGRRVPVEPINLSREAGWKVMELWEKNICPRDIITESAITNAIRVCMAIGGSSNTIIHIPAVAMEACPDLDRSSICAQASCEVPLLIGIRPNGKCLHGGLRGRRRPERPAQ
ncbi:MAG: dihydroxy-acid dehydratase [Dysosmobacter sp.]